jgi:ribonuclease HI
MITAYTDGSASVKSMKGGCGSWIKYKDSKEHFISKGFYPTKTGRMELMAVILTLQSIKDKSETVLIYSDSKYVVNTVMQGWLDKWEREFWQNNKNTDICKVLKEELFKFTLSNGKVILKHIKGHQDNLQDEHIYGNNVADALADLHNFTEFEKDLEVTREEINESELKFYNKENGQK